LLEILFKRAAFPQGQGLYWMPPEPGEMITTNPQLLRVAPLLTQASQDIGGFQFWFFEFEFSLLAAGIAPGVRTRFDDAWYRPAGIRAVGSNAQIAFDWQDGPQSREVVLNYVRP
jgi:hypothetical protein